MGDAADMLWQQEYEAWESHILGECGAYDFCQYCEHEENLMQGRIDNIKPWKSGLGANVIIGGVEYMTKENLPAAGSVINFVPSPSKDPTKPSWINDFIVVDEQGYSHTDPGPAHAGAYPSENPAPPEYREPRVSSGAGGARDVSAYLPFTSNMCAHLIQAGLIKTGDDLRNWADNSMAAIIHAVNQNS